MCAAFSLRTWRRNGIACDELIFLPGTKHNLKAGAVSTLEHFIRRLASNANITDSLHNNDTTNNDDCEKKNDAMKRDDPEMNHDETIPILAMDDDESSSTDEDSDVKSKKIFRREMSCSELSSANIHNESGSTGDNENSLESGIPLRRTTSITSTKEAESVDESENDNSEGPILYAESWDINNDEHYAYAPSATSVFGGGLDLLIPVLFNFHIFTVAIKHQNPGANQLSPKILPLGFLTILFFRAVIPFSRRRRFWGTLKYSFMAPFHAVSFRDDFVADILTSSVKPLQDMAFAIFYYTSVIRGLSSKEYKLEDLDKLLEKNWMLHNVVLPACAILPLWFKFMQCIRLAHDTKQRWPHLGNAFKYLSAVLIILHAMAHPQKQRGMGFIFFFVLATIYQIFWDTLIDWELFVYRSNEAGESPIEIDIFVALSNMPQLASWDDRLLTGIRILYTAVRQKIACFLSKVHLRSKRLFKDDMFYWRLFWINACLRFCWMLNFIPAHHLSPTGEKVYSFSSDVNNYVGVFLSSAEIIRRCLWGIFRVEIESIKITDPTYVSELPSWGLDFRPEKELPTTEIENSENETSGDENFRTSRYLTPSVVKKLRILEIVLWGSAFIGLGYVTLSN